jgi:hypothetical protein
MAMSVNGGQDLLISGLFYGITNNNFITYFKRAGLASTSGICCADSNAINFGFMNEQPILLVWINPHQY